MMLPDLLVDHRCYEDVIAYLQEHFYVIVGSYEGFDEKSERLYPGYEETLQEIKSYFHDRGMTSLKALYTAGYAYHFALGLRDFPIAHIICDEPPLSKKGLTRMQKMRLIRKLKKQRDHGLEKPNVKDQDGLRYEQGWERFYGHSMHFVRDQSLERMVMTFPDSYLAHLQISPSIHLIYGLKHQRPDLENVLYQFHQVHIAFYPFDRYELLIAYPYRFVQTLRDCLGGSFTEEAFWYQK